MEQDVQIDTGDGKTIYSRFREIPGAPLVIILHGMTGHMNGRLELGFSRELEKAGYSSLRYNAYDWSDDARDLCDMGLSEHLDDLDRVISWANDKADVVLAVGHSFGATCLLLRGSLGLAAGVLWDPANQAVWSEMNRAISEFDAQRRQFAVRDRVGIFYSERLPVEMENADAQAAAKSWFKPLFVVSSPEWPHISEAGRLYADAAPNSKHIELQGADHNFTDDHIEAELFSQTISWMNRNIA